MTARTVLRMGDPLLRQVASPVEVRAPAEVASPVEVPATQARKLEPVRALPTMLRSHTSSVMAATTSGKGPSGFSLLASLTT